jgi:AraC-like DNA-binding protein
MRDENLPHLQVKHDTLMYALAKKNNQTDKALEYLESFTKNKIKLLEQNGRKQIDEIKIKYESEKKDLLISNQKLEILASKRIHKITFLIIVLFCIVFVFLFLDYQKKKRTVHLIYKKEKEKDFEIKKLQERLSSYSLIKHHIGNHIVEQENPKPDKHINDKDNSYPLEKSAELFELFITRLESEKLYLEPDIDQNRIVKILGTNKKYLYEAISKHSDLNFRGIINRFRIKESKSTIEQKLKENETLNLSAIYTECGFNSNSSFYRTFKLITGITPNDYALELKKEL